MRWILTWVLVLLSAECLERHIAGTLFEREGVASAATGRKLVKRRSQGQI